MLEIKRKQEYSGAIKIGDKVVKTMAQRFDENGEREGGIGEYTVDKELYYSHLSECRKDEDTFIAKMREIEDSDKAVIEDESK